ncbi:MAG: 2-amino-4-hydroxy-6-hydroxymethyldihydropteridine diphosphokinase [Prevotella sp.]|nr:2-amino-4-hydroxy-6-hydroxymethyldihydropteridine diphosphokinase [Prevotella sp.]
MKPEQLHTVYLGLGSNLGNREETIRTAMQLIGGQIGTIVRQSALYYSKPWGFRSENSFVNAVVCVETALTPRKLLKATQKIERSLGKNEEHATKREISNLNPQISNLNPQPSILYRDRPIDIDILLYDDLTVSEPDLVIPHPLMQERPFVMEPLSEIMAQGHKQEQTQDQELEYNGRNQEPAA